MPRRTLLLAATLFCFGLAGAAGADDSKPGWGYTLSNELMSPYCPGRSLPDCPSPQAAELREWIVLQEKQGRTHDDVLAQLLAKFGEGLLQKPRATGFGLTAYLTPIAGVLAGGALLLVFFRRQMARGTRVPATPHLAPVDPELERLVDEEFERARGRG